MFLQKRTKYVHLSVIETPGWLWDIEETENVISTIKTRGTGKYGQAKGT